MATTSAVDTIDRIWPQVQQFSRSWMFAKSTDARGIELGFASGGHFWLVGRAGVLGSCPEEVAAAALAFQSLERVRTAWRGVPDGMTHYEVALQYKDVLVGRGVQLFDALDHDILERVAGLGRTVVDEAPAALGAIFAGWRQLGLPESLAGRTALTINTIRELRGAAHIAAVLACGLTPLDAILAAPDPPPRTGPAYAERMGYVGPFRDPEEIREQRLQAETLTKAILEPFFAVLSPKDLTLFGDAMEAVGNAVAAGE